MKKASILLLTIATAGLLAGCATDDLLTKNDKPEATATTAKSATPAKTAATKSEPAQAEGERKEVKGLGDWTGYIQGKPAHKSKFVKLQIGMSQQEVIDRLGYPTDQRGNSTIKAYIPLIPLSGTTQTTYYYKGQGRLVFANSSGSYSSYHLVGIEHDSTERGYHQ